ncbi:methyltransferase family protein [Fulvivirgaceae bacterium LMO-SS25]
MNSIIAIDSYISLLILAWALFGLTHSLFANKLVKDKLTEAIPNYKRYYRFSYNIFALISLGGILVFSTLLPTSTLFESSVIWEFIGLMFATYGLLISRIALKSYGIREFLGIDFNDAPVSFKKLKRSGLLAYVRHPLYCGTILLFLGVVFYFPTVANLVNFISVFTYILVGIYFEERKLVYEYGEEYKSYKAQVPMLLPSLK